MRITKNIRACLTLVGAAAIVWGALVGPAHADDVTATDASSTTTTSTTLDPSTTTTSTTIAPTTTTTVVTPGDPDGDGVSNEEAVDVFGDGITADQDPTVAVIGDGRSDGVVVALDTENNEQLRNVVWSATRSVGSIALPSGYVSFNVVNVTGPVDVITLWPDKDAKARSLYKGSATAMTQIATTDTHFEQGIAEFDYRITDGGAGDADHLVNGTIVDPVGPGYAIAATPTTTAKKASLARTGTSTGPTAAAGFGAILLGLVLLAVAWKPVGAHYSFDRR